MSMLRLCKKFPPKARQSTGVSTAWIHPRNQTREKFNLIQISATLGLLNFQRDVYCSDSTLIYYLLFQKSAFFSKEHYSNEIWKSDLVLARANRNEEKCHHIYKRKNVVAFQYYTLTNYNKKYKQKKNNNSL